MKLKFRPQYDKLAQRIAGGDLQDEVNKAFAEFKPKSFVEKNIALKRAASIGSILFHILGIALAFTFVASVVFRMLTGGDLLTFTESIGQGFLGWVKFIGACVLSLAVLIIVELFKRRLTSSIAYSRLREKKVPYLQVIFYAALIAISVGSTVGGGYEIASQRTEKPVIADALAARSVFDANTDNVILSLDKSINNTSSTLSDMQGFKGQYGAYPWAWYKKSEKRTYPNPKLTKAIAAKELELSKLEQRKADRIKELESKGETSFKTVSTSNLRKESTYADALGENKAILYIISAIAETGVLACLIFIAVFQFKVTEESLEGLSLDAKEKDFLEFKTPFKASIAASHPAIEELDYEVPAPARKAAGFTQKYKKLQPEKLEPKEVGRQGIGLREDSYRMKENPAEKLAQKIGENNPEILGEILARLKDLESLKNWANSLGKETEINLKEGDKKSFEFYASKPPYNKGKSYDVTPSQMKKIKKVKSAYDSILSKLDGGALPTLKAVAEKAKVSEPTARKYLDMAELETWKRG